MKKVKLILHFLAIMIVGMTLNVNAVESTSISIASEFIAGEEQFRAKAYDDATGKTLQYGDPVKGYATIGYGHKLTLEELNKSSFLNYNIYDGSLPEELALKQITKEEAFLRAVSLVPSMYNKNQQAALISLGYNAGPSVLKYVIMSSNEEEMLLKWANIIRSKGKVMRGLVKRRTKEIYLFLKGNK